MSKNRAGKISVKLFDRMQELGFTDIENIQELIDNSIDADAKNIYIISENVNDSIEFYFVDDGVGMNMNGLIKYYEIAEDKNIDMVHDKFPIGSKGMGGKIATINLSNRSLVSIISRDDKNNWVESSYDWSSEEYINNVIVSTKICIEDKELIHHIFHDILKINEPDTFTVISFKTNRNILSDKICEADKSILYNLGITYSLFIENGLNINIVNDNTIQKVKNIPMSFTKNNSTYFPEEMNKITIPKHKSQNIGDLDYIGYFNDVSLVYNKDYCLCSNGEIYEFENDKIYHYRGVNGNNQFVSGRFKEKYIIQDQNELKDILVHFKLRHTYYNNSIELKNSISSKYLNNIILDDNTCLKTFYGTHFVRNGKNIVDSAIDYKEIKSGDYYKRNWNKSQFIIEFNSISHNIDKHFGIMVNKSRLNKSNIHESIIKLIHYLIYENSITFQKIMDEKIAKIKKNIIVTEPVVFSTEPVVSSTEPVVSSTEPVVFSTEPVVSSTEPVVSSTEPVVSSTDDNEHKSIKNVSKIIQIENNGKDNRQQFKLQRKTIAQNDKKLILQKQGNKEKYTEVNFNNYLRYEIDHIDGNPGNNNDDNLQAISPNLHSIKTNDPELYHKIIKNPAIYNLSIALTHLESTVTINVLSQDNQKKLIKSINTIKELLKINGK